MKVDLGAAGHEAGALPMQHGDCDGKRQGKTAGER